MVTSKRLALGLLLLSLAVFAIGAGWLASGVQGGQDLVKLRNALIFRQGSEDAYSWTPDHVPANFLWEANQPPVEISALVERVLSSRTEESEFAKALALGRHLVGASNRSGNPIQKDVGTAYTAIVEKGEGFCSDYTQVVNGLSIAAGVPVREWGMSFDGFSGDGHAFSEIYDTQLRKWIFVDTFYSFYVTDRAGSPMSVLEFRDALSGGNDSDLRVVPIVEDRFMFPSKDYALEYYRSGMNLLFMVWGNNVFSYEANFFVDNASAVSRSVEQATAVLLGVHPKIVIIPSDYNRDELKSLVRLRTLILVTLVSAVLSVIAAFYLLVRSVGRWRSRRSRRDSGLNDSGEARSVIDKVEGYQ